MKYEDYAEKIGFVKQGNIYVKEQDGFKMYLKDWQYIILNIPSFYIPLDKPITKEEINKISKAIFDTACAPFTLKAQGDTLIVSLPEGKKDQEKFVLLAISQTEKVAQILKEDGYGPMKECPLCGKEAEYNPFSDNYCPMHEECKNAYVKKVEEEIKKEDKKVGLYVLSILASIVLSVVGLLPSFFLGYYNHSFFTALVALTPILNAVGYFFIKAPNRKWLKIVLGVIPFALIVGFGIYIIPYMAGANNLSFGDYCFTNGWVGFRKILFMTILAFGSFGSIKFVSKFKVDYKKELEKLNK